MTDEFKAANPDILEQIEQHEADSDERDVLDPTLRGGGPYIVPVVFHVIHVNGPEKIARSQIEDALRVLNEDFNLQNWDTSQVIAPFNGIMGNAGIEFRLAQKDPNGNCHPGINYVYSELTNVGDQSMKDLIVWPREMYLNVWVCVNPDGAAGYALLPLFAHFTPEYDGIVVAHNYLGSIGTSNYTNSRTLTHEVGHYLNLHHTWGDGTVGDAGNCGDDDGVADTPNTIGWYSACPQPGSSCSTQDNVRNFMEYSYCARMFTQGQVDEMIDAITNSGFGSAERSDLWQPSNLAATGVNGATNICAADFSTTVTVICQGDSVQFFDESYHGITQRDWTFSGATPATSTDQDPWVVYDTPGTYDVSLTAGDGTTSVTETKTAYIVVLPGVGVPVPFYEDFESTAPWSYPNWFDENGGGPGWNTTTAASHSGSQSLWLENRNSAPGEIDEFSSVTYDLYNATTAKITFWYAFKETNGSNDDKLQVLVSSDCGRTWSIRRTLQGSLLVTSSGFSSSNWAPNSSEWSYAEVTSIPSTFWGPNFRFKFLFTAGGGNNVYIDQINLDVTIDVDENEMNYGLNIYPNPMDDASTIEFELPNNEEVNLGVVDLVGKQVLDLGTGSMGQGRHVMELPADELAPGIYFVRLQVADNEVTRKIIVR